MVRRTESQFIALEEENIFRYPGARPFQDNEYAPLLFYGREDEQKQAQAHFEQWRLLLIDGRPAVGKTSFLRAGLFPQLRRDRYFPIYARPSDLVRGGLTGYIRTMLAHGDEVARELEKQGRSTLKTQMEAIADHLESKKQTPVLVIDQLEQVLTQLKEKQATALNGELRELLRQGLAHQRAAGTRAAREAAESGQDRPRFGLILSTQTDFLEMLESTPAELPLGEMPEVLLRPLNRRQARRAIVRPGMLSLAGLVTAQMEFDEPVVDRLMELLTDRGRSEEIEPLHIQLLCRDIEETIIINEREGLLGTAPVIPAFLSAENGLHEVLRRFYETQINSIDRFVLRQKARALCERGLINSRGEPQSLKADTLAGRFGLSGEELHQLMELRLIGLQGAEKTYRCFLSHPSFVEPVLESRRDRLARSEGAVFRTGTALLLLCLVAFAGYRYALRPLLDQSRLAERAQQDVPQFGGITGVTDPGSDETAGAAAPALDPNAPAAAIPAAATTAAGDGDAEPLALARTPESRALYYDSIGQTEEALDLYEYVLKKNPAHPFAARRASQLYADLGQETQGLDLLKTIRNRLSAQIGQEGNAEKMSDRRLVANLALGRNYRATADLFEVEGNITEAEKHLTTAAGVFRTAVKRSGRSELARRELLDTLQALGEMYYQQKAFEQAEEIFSEAVLSATAQDPVPTTPLLWRARARRAAGDFLGAKEDYDRIILEHPRRASYLYERAETWFQMQDYDKCIEDCYKANLRDADNALVYNLVAKAHMEMGEFDKAVDYFTRALNLDPRLFRAYLSRANALLEIGNFEQAVADYTRMIELQPHRHSTYGNRGIAYKQMGELQKAIQDFSHLINYYPDDPKAYYNRGNTYYDLGDFTNAILDFNQAISLRPDFARAYNNRALAHYSQDDLESAIEDYTRAIELDSTYDYAYSNRGRTYQDLQQMERALQDYNTAITLNPRNSLAYAHRGEYFAETGNLEEAVTDLTRAIELSPENPQFYILRADAYERLGEVDKAEKDSFRAEQLEGAAARRRLLQGAPATDPTPGADPDGRPVPLGREASVNPSPAREDDPLDLFQ